MNHSNKHTQTDAHLTQRGVTLSPKQPSPSKAEHTAWSQTSFTSYTSYRAFLLLQKPLLHPLFLLPLLLFSPYPWYAYSSLPFHLFCPPNCPDFSLFISRPFLLSPLFSLSAFLIPSIVFPSFFSSLLPIPFYFSSSFFIPHPASHSFFPLAFPVSKLSFPFFILFIGLFLTPFLTPPIHFFNAFHPSYLLASFSYLLFCFLFYSTYSLISLASSWSSSFHS